MTSRFAKFIWPILDASLVALSLYLAFALRFGFNIPTKYMDLFISICPIIIILKITIFHFFGLNRQIWRHASIKEANRVISSIFFASISTILFFYIAQIKLTLPRSIFIADWLLCTALVGGSRYLVRIFEDFQLDDWKLKLRKNIKRTLVVGAGEAGALLTKKMKKYSDFGYYPVAFIDDNPKKQGYFINGIPVLGNRTRLEKVVGDHEIDEVIIALPSASGEAKKDIVFKCKQLNITCKTIPAISELINGNVKIDQIRDIEVEDILGREAIRIDLKKISNYLSGKRVVITGAAGSIGSELCRQIANLNTELIVALDNSEGGLFNLKQELSRSFEKAPIEYRVCDVKNENFVDQLFFKYRPHAVFHAAAYKHVELMQSHPLEAMENNLVGTKVVAQAAENYASEGFVLISSDKAVNPANIMGASKAFAEKYIQILQRNSNNKTNFTIVRFGNVLGSNGSVVPIFRKQIEKRQPVTVTHPEMTRYFMTITEAVHLVIQAGAMSSGNEIYVLNMGDPVSILDLAHNMIKLSGFEPDKDIPIRFTGIKPGEKLNEELFHKDEKVIKTQNSKINKTQPQDLNQNFWQKILFEIEDLISQNNVTKLVDLTADLFPNCKDNHEKIIIDFEEAKTRSLKSVL